MSMLNKNERSLIKTILHKKLTYLSKARLACILLSLKDIKAKNLKGSVIEAGCALGGSSILISKFKRNEADFSIYDVFGMIPPPSDKDDELVHKRYNTILKGESSGLGGELYYGYEENLYDKVLENFEDFNVNVKESNISLVKGLVQDTMNINEPIVFAHIDVDWYDPVKTCLEQIWPNLVTNGCIILDDYYYWGGCKKATDEFFLNKTDYIMENNSGSMKVIKL